MGKLGLIDSPIHTPNIGNRPSCCWEAGEGLGETGVWVITHCRWGAGGRGAERGVGPEEWQTPNPLKSNWALYH